MMAIVEFLVFAAALAASLAVFGLTLVPEVPRIVALLRYGVDPVREPRVTILSEPRLRARVAVVSRAAARPDCRAAA